MPATEQTWRNQKLMHRIFAASSVLLLVATVWMFLADHTREWKNYQITARNIDLQMTSWRELQYQTAEALRQHDELSALLLREQSRAVPESLLERFKNEVNADAARRRLPEYDFATIDQLAEELKKWAKEAAEARKEANVAIDAARQAEQSAAQAQVDAEEARTKIATAEDRSAAENAVVEAQRRAVAQNEIAEIKRDEAAEAEAKAIAAEKKAADQRQQFLERLDTIISAARFRENELLRERKFTSADMDAAKATLDLAVRDNKPQSVIDEQQRAIDDLKAQVDELSLRYEAANEHRKSLQDIRAQITQAEDAAAKDLADNRSELDRLKRANVDRRSTYFTWDEDSIPFFGKKWLELPILDAFNSPLKIENLWDEDNKIDYNFQKVRRFDRCTTCHLNMQKTMPGSAVEPAYVNTKPLDFILTTPTEEEFQQAEDQLAKLQREWARFKSEHDEAGPEPTLEEVVYGIRLAGETEYLFDRKHATISFVQPYSRYSDANSRGAQARLVLDEAARQPVEGDHLRQRAMQGQAGSYVEDPDARQGLMVGDVIVRVNDDLVRDPSHARQMLLAPQVRGKPLRLQIQRGLPNPYTSHPRLDLFVGSISPHTMEEFACTICHEGQGSATAFKWASHTPDTPRQRERWSIEHGWFDNHHWIFPMYPKRFAESSCLKCHHDVTELEPSERFPDPPAPTVTHGHHLVTKYGCFGCHEINGWDGPTERVGPDLRLEPNYFAAALQLKVDPGIENLTEEERDWLEQLIHHPERDEVRHRLYDMLVQDAPTLSYGVHDRLLGVDGTEGLLAVEALPENEDAAGEVESDRVDAAEIILRDPGYRNLTREQRQLIEELIRDPGKDEVRQAVYEMVLQDKPRLSRSAHTTIAPLLKDIEVPGTLRKVGPSLRFVRHKLTDEFLYDWIREPKHFRPDTRMPQFFGLWDHLEHKIHEQAKEAAEELETMLPQGELRELAKKVNAAHPDDESRRELWRRIAADRALPDEQKKLEYAAHEIADQLVDDAERYEPVELLAIATYLRERTQPFDYIEPAVGIDASEDAEQRKRGKEQFQVRGCLACHNHSAFDGDDGLSDVTAYRRPEEIVQGPDLSNLGAKLKHDEGRQWLYTWLKNPTSYHPRTVMPNLFLNPVEQKGKDAEGNPTVTRTDPAADIAAFLIDGTQSSWQPKPDTLVKLDGAWREILDEMVVQNLKESNSSRAAEQYLEKGIPESRRYELKGPEIELVGTKIGEKEKLLYIGRKAIAKHGCYACHDIPGFEDAKPIGTGLADWGRKNPAQLAFEHITHYLHLDQKVDKGEQLSFYEEALMAGHRSGFIYQKLREPRSYDYHKTENKRYNERLRMPMFPFDDEEREAIITFVLGLIADPPASKFVYQPDERQRALIEGRQVLEKYNCGGCHILGMEKWQIAYPPGTFENPAVASTYPFLSAHFSPEEIAASATPDERGLLRATLVGLPSIDNSDGLPDIYDEYGDPVSLAPEDDYAPSSLEYYFDIYEPVVLEGLPHEVGVRPLSIQARLIDKKYPTDGGTLAKYLVPVVTKIKKQQPGEQVKAKEAWGWVPPPLIGEGKKVQSEWLHSFLLDPHEIRPLAVLRMPKFNMTPDEATKLVNYFAAVDHADYPYQFKTRTQSEHVAKAEAQYENLLKELFPGGPPDGSRFDHALRIVADKKNGCVQCHIVGDFREDPKGPDLQIVYKRLRPEYVRDWIARPVSILPYTSMPENIKYNPDTPEQDGFVATDAEGNPVKYVHGSSTVQLNALVDLLMNFDHYWLQQQSMSEVVQASAPTEAEAPAAGEAETSGTGSASGAAP